MRHGDKIKNLSRTASHRSALLSNMASELIAHKRIITTLAKAKALRVYIEPLITKAKENTTHQRRIVFSYLQNKEAIIELFSAIAEKVGGRPGGYTRIIKLGIRQGDNAETALIELVDFNEIYGKGKGEVKEPAKKTRRSRASKKSEPKAEASTATETTTQPFPAESSPVTETITQTSLAEGSPATETTTQTLPAEASKATPAESPSAEKTVENRPAE